MLNATIPSLSVGTLPLGMPSMEAPSEGVEAPLVGVKAPLVGVKAQSLDTKTPSVGVEALSVSVGASSVGVQAPSVGVEAPMVGVEAPLLSGEGQEVVLQITLDGELTIYETRKEAILADLAAALYAPGIRFSVLSVVAGSIVITASASVPACLADEISVAAQGLGSVSLGGLAVQGVVTGRSIDEVHKAVQERKLASDASGGVAFNLDREVLQGCKP